MEGEICKYDKFGYCKYKKDCKRTHFTEECEDLDNFKSIKNCMKRHPKCCKQHAYGKCRFESDCSYKHLDTIKNKEQIQLEERLSN